MTTVAGRIQDFLQSLGEGVLLLFETLFDEADAARLDKLIGRDRPWPVIQVRSNDALLLALPWELLYHNDVFLVRTAALTSCAPPRPRPRARPCSRRPRPHSSWWSMSPRPKARS